MRWLERFDAVVSCRHAHRGCRFDLYIDGRLFAGQGRVREESALALTNASVSRAVKVSEAHSWSVRSAAASALRNTKSGARVTNLGGIGNGTLKFNNVATTAAGSYWLTIYYINPSSLTDSMLMSVNGGLARSVPSLPPTATNGAPGSTTVKVTLAAGSNAIQFSQNTGSVPDIDRIAIE
jgi:hypothetical protein